MVGLGKFSRLGLIGAAAVLASAVYSWNWLVALGGAPLLLSVLPCGAMCALGLRMNHAIGRACAKGAASPEQTSRGMAKAVTR